MIIFKSLIIYVGFCILYNSRLYVHFVLAESNIKLKGFLSPNKKMARKRSPSLERMTFHSVFIFVLETLWLLFLIIPSFGFSILRNLFFKPMKDLSGKIVLITGAGNGLGKELALQLSRQKCTILCIDINEDDNKKTVKEILEKNGKGRAYTCDVSDPTQTRSLSEIILDEFGKVDILINNAGLIFGNGILTGTNEEILRVLNVNFMSNLWMIRAFLPSMIKRNEGHIVCIGSASGIHSLGQGSIYSCTKFAILGLVYSMMEEFRNNDQYKNIKISCALPYFINTNKLYSQHWRLRLPALSTQKAAALVIEGFRREFQLYTVPWITFGYNISSSLRILPMNVYNFFRDKCYADFTFDDSIETQL